MIFTKTESYYSTTDDWKSAAKIALKSSIYSYNGIAGARPRGVNGTDNFRSKFASASTFKNIVCNNSNPTDMDAYTDIAHADIR
jgi:hypothetical protein